MESSIRFRDDILLTSKLVFVDWFEWYNSFSFHVMQKKLSAFFFLPIVSKEKEQVLIFDFYFFHMSNSPLNFYKNVLKKSAPEPLTRLVIILIIMLFVYVILEIQFFFVTHG